MMANEKRLIDANELMSDVYRADEQQKNDIWHTSDIEYLLEAQTTVDAVEVVHGRWESWGIFDDLAKCSVCGADSFTMHFVHYHNFKHCPNCGAKMN